jgi:hypothetical protein
MLADPPLRRLVVHVVRPGERHENVHIQERDHGISSSVRRTISGVTGLAPGDTLKTGNPLLRCRDRAGGSPPSVVALCGPASALARRWRDGSSTPGRWKIATAICSWEGIQRAGHPAKEDNPLARRRPAQRRAADQVASALRATWAWEARGEPDEPWGERTLGEPRSLAVRRPARHAMSRWPAARTPPS